MMKLSHPRAWLTVEEVALHLGLSEERVRQLIRTNQIKATKIGGWLVHPEDLDTFIRSRTNFSASEDKNLQRGIE